MIQFTAIQYLKMDIASSFGLDKESWGSRLAWFDENQHQLSSLVKQAEEPAQFLAGTMAYRDVMAGLPTGYLCGWDATASGLQLLSLLSGCEQSAGLCNLINTGRREDAYTLVYAQVCQLLGTTGNVDRKALKDALMTHLYGSTAEPKKAFGEDTPELKAFYQAIDEMLPGADMLNRDLIALWNPEALAHSWTLPDGFDVVVKVMVTIEHEVTLLGKAYTVNEKVNRPKAGGLSMGANIIHSIDGMIVREMNRRCNFTASTVIALENLLASGCFGGLSTERDKDLALLRLLALYETTGFLSAVIFEHIDERNLGHLEPTMRYLVIQLINSLPEVSFPLICIHDMFKAHANYGNDVRNQYKQILSELADSDTLQAIASEIAGRDVPVTKLSNNLPAKILSSEYAIC